jgi:predicted dehydrogenase
MDRIDRRDFLRGAAVATASLAAPFSAELRAHPSVSRGGQGTGPAPSGVLGASDRIVAGFIGAGRQGCDDMRSFLKQQNVEIAVVCDVYEPNLNKGAAIAGQKAQKVKDFRRILDNNDINVVGIAAPDHWHAVMAIMACQAGKDVFVQKPISVSIEEGRKMVQAARRYQRIMQVGTQQRSGVHFQKVAEIVRGGRLGTVNMVRTWDYGNDYPEGWGNPPDAAPPADLDWEMWLGPAPKRPFNANRFGVGDRWSTFRYFWDYAGGMMTDWGVHLLDIVQWAMNVEAPLAVTASGGRFAMKDNCETPDTLQVTYEYPGFVAVFENRDLNSLPFITGKTYGIMFHGTDGTLFVDREGYQISPEKKGRGAAATNRIEPETGKNSNNQLTSHWQNFVECVRSRRPPISDIEIGHRSTSTCHLGNVAYRSRRRIEWDGKAEKVKNASMKDLGPGAMFLNRPHRKPWKL